MAAFIDKVGIEKADVHERDVLRDYGNVSAPTVLFVLERLIAAA